MTRWRRGCGLPGYCKRLPTYFFASILVLPNQHLQSTPKRTIPKRRAGYSVQGNSISGLHPINLYICYYMFLNYLSTHTHTEVIWSCIYYSDKRFPQHPSVPESREDAPLLPQRQSQCASTLPCLLGLQSNKASGSEQQESRNLKSGCGRPAYGEGSFLASSQL